MKSNEFFAFKVATADGELTVAQIIAEMQQEGVPQKLIDRWLQGLQAGILRAGRS